MMRLEQLTGEFLANPDYAPCAILLVKASVKPGFRASKDEKCFTQEGSATPHQEPAILPLLALATMVCEFRVMPTARKECQTI